MLHWFIEHAGCGALSYRGEVQSGQMDADVEAVRNARLAPGLCELLSTPAASAYLFPGTYDMFEAAPALMSLCKDRGRLQR